MRRFGGVAFACVRFGPSGAICVPHVCTKEPAQATRGSRRPKMGRSGGRGAGVNATEPQPNAGGERNRTQGANAGGDGAVRSPRLPTAWSRVSASERRGKRGRCGPGDRDYGYGLGRHPDRSAAIARWGSAAARSSQRSAPSGPFSVWFLGLQGLTRRRRKVRGSATEAVRGEVPGGVGPLRLSIARCPPRAPAGGAGACRGTGARRAHSRSAGRSRRCRR